MAKKTEKPTKSGKRQADGKFPKGVSGNPAGPKVGTKKAKTVLIEQKLIELGCDPIEGMVLMAQDKKTDAGIRAKLYSELANYIFPKRKAVEHSTKDGESLSFTVNMVNPNE
ncbi:MAG: hypothetical protein IID17_14290 [Nitrospinae bacterium]|nr:hypothetical protein [Nitrospinota bacterium]